MSIQLVCTCGKRLQAKAGLAGKQVTCPACRRTLAVPSPSTIPAGSGFLTATDDEARARAAAIAPYKYWQAIVAGAIVSPVVIAVLLGVVAYSEGLARNRDDLKYAVGNAMGGVLIGLIVGPFAGAALLWAGRQAAHPLAYPAIRQAKSLMRAVPPK